VDAVISAEARLATENAEQELRRLRSAHPGLVIQLVGVDKPLSTRAVAMIAAQTLRARETGSLLAAKPEVDLLLRLAGTSQITVALKKNGYRSGKTKLLVAAGPSKDVRRLKKELSMNTSYELREVAGLEPEGLRLVEIAALLGTRA